MDRPMSDFIKPGMSEAEVRAGARAWTASMGIFEAAANTPDCAGCAWWNEGYPTGQGSCRRNAPLLVPTEDGAETRWPLTRARDVCGEHCPAIN